MQRVLVSVWVNSQAEAALRQLGFDHRVSKVTLATAALEARIREWAAKPELVKDDLAA